jgi:hypothetical protein
VQFTVGGNANSQNIRYLCSENYHAVYRIPLLYLQVEDAMIICKIKGHVLLEETNFDHYASFLHHSLEN